MCATTHSHIAKSEAVAKAMLIVHEMAKLQMISHKDKERVLDAMGEIGRSDVLHFDREDFKALIDGRKEEVIAKRRQERLAVNASKHDNSFDVFVEKQKQGIIDAERGKVFERYYFSNDFGAFDLEKMLLRAVSDANSIGKPIASVKMTPKTFALLKSENIAQLLSAVIEVEPATGPFADLEDHRFTVYYGEIATK